MPSKSPHSQGTVHCRSEFPQRSSAPDLYISALVYLLALWRNLSGEWKCPLSVFRCLISHSPLRAQLISRYNLRYFILLRRLMELEGYGKDTVGWDERVKELWNICGCQREKLPIQEIITQYIQTHSLHSIVWSAVHVFLVRCSGDAEWPSSNYSSYNYIA